MSRTFLAALAIGAVLGFGWAARAADETVATVGDKKITRAQLEDEVRAKLIEIENQRYDALREGLDGMVAQELLKREAAARGTTAEALTAEEIDKKTPEPSDQDIQKVYEENKSQLGGQTLEQVKPRIVQYLKGQKQEERRTAFIEELKKKYPTTVSLKPPVVNVAAAGRPERGGKNASVTIIEFSDYQCPFCQRAEDVVEKVMSTYGDKVRLVYRNYPLPFHPRARPASEAAACANAQVKFWEYHSKLFHGDGLEAEKLKTYADQVGLDRKKFDECLEKKPFTAEIDKDVKDGEKAGVTGTPAFFINGRMLSGAQPFEKFKEVIDDELASSKKSS